jgi:hypothetical protein
LLDSRDFRQHDLVFPHIIVYPLGLKAVKMLPCDNGERQIVKVELIQLQVLVGDIRAIAVFRLIFFGRFRFDFFPWEVSEHFLDFLLKAGKSHLDRSSFLLLFEC